MSLPRTGEIPGQLALFDTPPVRLCCGTAHAEPVCPDGQVMCCICFGRFTQDELWVDGQGDRWDMCKECGAQNE